MTCINVTSLTLAGARVDEVYGLCDALNDAQLVHVSELLREFARKADDVVFAEWHDLHRERVFVVVRVVADVVRHQLLRCLPPANIVTS